MRSFFELRVVLKERGFTLSRINDMLKVEPSSMLTDILRTDIKAHKDALLKVIAKEEGGHAYSGMPMHSQCRACCHNTDHGTAGMGQCKLTSDSRMMGIGQGEVCRWFTAAGYQTVGRQERQRQTIPPYSTMALSWMIEHRQEARGHGWTMPELFSRKKYRQGIVWCGVWNKPDLKVGFTLDGAFVFDFSGTSGQHIRQTAQPLARLKKLSKTFNGEKQ